MLLQAVCSIALWIVYCHDWQFSFFSTRTHVWRQIEGTSGAPQQTNLRKPRHPLLQTGRSYGPLLQTLQRLYQARGKWQEVMKCHSVTSGWQVRLPSTFLKRRSLVLFADAMLESNCKTSFLYCTWYCSANTFHVPNWVAKTLVKPLHNSLKFPKCMIAFDSRVQTCDIS